MARYRAAIETSQTPKEIFDYLSDFSNAREWDPSVVEGERLDRGRLVKGSEFRLVAEFLGRRNELTYRIVEYDPPRAVTFLGANRSARSRDRITFEPIATGTRVTYDAELKLKGVLQLADPLLRLAFGQVGGRARAGLDEVLTRPRLRAVDSAA